MISRRIGMHVGVVHLLVLMFGFVSAAGGQPMPKGTTRLCDEFPAIDAQLPGLMVMLGINTDDFDEDGLPETAALALVRAVVCFVEDDTLPAEVSAAYEAMGTAARAAYELNLGAVDSDPGAVGVADFREVIAVLMFISAATQDALSAAFDDSGEPLSEVYEVVTCDAGDSCLPAALPDKLQYLVLADPTKAANEPYSGSGDPDDDTYTNAEEYVNIGERPIGFAAVAMDPAVGGPIASVTDGDGGCFIATAAYGSPIAGEIETLRAVRDRYLLKTYGGTSFVDAYYRMSPPIAGIVAGNGTLRGAVRVALTPVVMVSRALLWSPHATATAALVLCGLTGAYWGRSHHGV